jgi:hypothetical protein
MEYVIHAAINIIMKLWLTSLPSLSQLQTTSIYCVLHCMWFSMALPVGEELHVAAMREVYEEVGLLLKISPDHCFTASSVISHPKENKSNSTGNTTTPAATAMWHFVINHFIATIEEGGSTTLVPNSDASNAKWVLIDDLIYKDTVEAVSSRRIVEVVERGKHLLDIGAFLFQSHRAPPSVSNEAQ